MKKSILLLLVIVISVMFVSCDSMGLRPMSYETFEADSFLADYRSNLARTAEKYIGNSYQFHVKVTDISKDAKTITAKITYAYGTDWYVTSQSILIHGEILDKADQKKILEVNKGDMILISGRITDVDQCEGYSGQLKIDIHKIEIQ